MGYATNLVLIFLMGFLLSLFFYHIFRKEQEITYSDFDEFSLEYLVKEIKETFNQILNTSITEFKLDKIEAIKEEKRKEQLRQALRTCNYGDGNAKEFIKEYIKDLLQLKYQIDEKKISSIISFHDYGKLSIQDKFEILIYIYKKEHGANGLQAFIETYDLASYRRDKDHGYEIKMEHIEDAYDSEIGYLSFGDKLEIVSQRIYQMYKGHGVIDEIRDMNIDGISAGVSGLTNVLYQFKEEFYIKDYKEENLSFNSIWLFYQGKTLHLSFLGFGSQKELERVCKNIYRYDNPGQLSAQRGYIANEMKDGSRIIVVRPPFSESWAFFLRKFQSVKEYNIYSILPDKGSEIPIQTLKWLIKGCQVIAITGEQGSGKSTLLKHLISFIDPTYTLRVQELIFELNLRKLYPKRNILSFRETTTVSGQDALDIQKKTDGVVTILGEVATGPVARWLVQLSQVASKFTIFTHHGKTTKSLVTYLRNALLQEGGFNNEKIAEEQVVEAVNFDVHFMKSVEGHRYIERITQIVPYQEDSYEDGLLGAMEKYYKNRNQKHVYQTIDIICYEKGEYHFKNPISKGTIKNIAYHLTKSEKEEFSNYLKGFPSRKEDLL